MRLLKYSTELVMALLASRFLMDMSMYKHQDTHSALLLTLKYMQYALPVEAQ